MISKENAMKLKWLWQNGHEIEWIEAFVKIADKEGNIVPFKLTKQQKKFVRNMTKKNAILKARQLGFSVVSLALMLRLAIVKPYTNSKIYSFEADSAVDNFEKLKIMYKNLPSFLKVKAEAANRDTLKFSNGSIITCKTIGKSEKGKGKGSTINGILHLTEFSYYKNAQEQLVSLTKATSSSATIILESTAYGVANYFCKHYFDAKEGINGYKAFFYNWIDCPELFYKDFEQAKINYELQYGKPLSMEDLDDEEKSLIKMGASLEQLCWRRFEIVNDGIDKFYQERPVHDLQAFLSTGSSAFSNERITEIEKNIVLNKIKYIPIENITDLPMILKNHYGKSFFMWQIPKAGEKYFIGCDPAGGTKGDNSAIVIFNKEGEQVGEFYNNKLKTYEISEVLNSIGHYFNKGLITCEVNNMGNSVVERMRYTTYHYMNMTKYKTFDQFNKTIIKVGFNTNPITKPLIVNDLVELFDKGLIKINSLKLLGEMKTFIKDDDGKFKGSGSNHDDLVMACALAIVSFKSPFYYSF